jgi:hypothetical protein
MAMMSIGCRNPIPLTGNALSLWFQAPAVK